MKVKLVFLIAIALTVSLLSASTMKTVSARNLTSSTRWAGYVLNSSGVTSITASWTIPSIQCGPSTNTISNTVTVGVSVWIGFDGLTPNTTIPEHIGTTSFCLNGTPQYTAFEEDSTLNTGQRVALPQIYGGDEITSAITYLGNNQFRLSIADAQSGGSRTYTLTIPNAARVSAEWIVEDPWSTLLGGYLSLPTFQTVTFSGCSASVNSVSGSILQNNVSSISMVDSNGKTIVAPQNLNQAGTSFQVAEVAPVPETPSTLLLLLPALLLGAYIPSRKKSPTL